MFDVLVPVNDHWSISGMGFLFLIALMLGTMYKLRWAYSPSVGEELKEINYKVDLILKRLDD